jgi:glycosyltransferase involved in cell wall biosynthesis
VKGVITGRRAEKVGGRQNSRSRRMKVSVVIPTLNEEDNIKRVFETLPKSVDEVVVVDGHSKDRTVQIAKKYGPLILYDNRGKGSAIRKGVAAAKGDIIIMMDADCSNIPAEIELLIAGIKAGYDICMGSRFIQGGGTEDMPWYRMFGNKFFVLMVNILWGMEYSDLCYGYRSLRKGVMENLNLEENGFGIETEISIKAAKKRLKVLEVPSYEKIRAGGEAKLRTFRGGLSVLGRIIKEL